MADMEERPAKMRKLDNTSEMVTDASAQPQFASTTTVPGATETHGQDPAIHNTSKPQASNENTVLSADQRAAVDAAMKQQIDADPKMSKSQRKKLRKKLEWEAGKEARKAYKKSKEQIKKTAQAAERAERIAAGLLPPPVKKPRPPPSIQVPVTLLIDCDFDSYMLDKEIMSLSQQITRSYSDVKNGRYRANMVISSFGGRMRERYETVLARHHEAWKGVTFTEKFFTEAAKDAHEEMISKQGGRLAGALAGKEQHERDNAIDKANAESGVNGVEGDEGVLQAEEEAVSKLDSNDNVASESAPSAEAPLCPIPTTPQLVYLSSDSEHTLSRLSPYTTYIIGGIVDKNRHKGLCHRRAEELGIPTAKLPIGEYMEMQSRTVLATNHVVEIMVNWLESGDWGEAFLKAIPKRKEATLRKMRRNNAEDPENAKKNGEKDEDGKHVDEEEDEDVENAEDAGEMEAKTANAAAETAQKTERQS